MGTTLIDHAGMKWEVSSSERDCGVEKLLDGKWSTYWQSAISSGARLPDGHVIRLTCWRHSFGVDELVIMAALEAVPSFFPTRVSLAGIASNSEGELPELSLLDKFRLASSRRTAVDLWKHVPAASRQERYTSLVIRIFPDGINCRVHGFSVKTDPIAVPPPSSFGEDMWNMLEDELFADMRFRVGSQTLPAHRSIVAARCPVMRAMLESGMAESVGPCEVVIQDIEYPVMRELLRYLYTDRTPDASLASELLEAAEKYQLGRLKAICGQQLADAITVGSCCDVLSLATRFRVPGLWERCMHFAVKHASELLKTEGMQRMTAQHPEVLTQLFAAGSCGVDKAFEDLGVAQWEGGACSEGAGADASSAPSRKRKAWHDPNA